MKLKWDFVILRNFTLQVSQTKNLKTTSIDYRDNNWGNVKLEKRIKALQQLCNNKKILRFTELKKSNINKIFKVDLADSSLILKISPKWYNKSLLREKWCYGKLGFKIKIPKAFFYLPASNPVFPTHEVLALEYIRGKQLKQADFSLRQINEKVSEIFMAVHSINSEGYGFLNRNFVGIHKSWIDFLLDIENIEVPLSKKYIKKEDVEWLKESLASIKINDSHSLLYGDFRPENFILCKNEIVALDFQNCISGMSLYDIGIGLFNIQRIYEYADLYWDRRLKSIEKTAMMLYATRHATTVMSHSLMTGDIAMANFARTRFYRLKSSILA